MSNSDVHEIKNDIMSISKQQMMQDLVTVHQNIMTGIVCMIILMGLVYSLLLLILIVLPFSVTEIHDLISFFT